MAKRNRAPGPGDVPFPGMPSPRVRGTASPNPRVRGHADAARRGVPKPTGVSNAHDWASGETAQAEAFHTQTPFMAEALRRAESGDDSMLLPYQPTPSINPPRPRTLAAGYDAKTRTMRVRFRDGAGYEYYNVNPQTWQNFKRVKSPGRAINRYFPPGSNYARAPW
jgi:hypothetical protein